VSDLVLVDGCLAAQFVYVRYVYAHLPYFADKGIPVTDRCGVSALKDWLRCNLVTHVLTAAMQVWILKGPEGEKLYQALVNAPPFQLMPFLAKLAMARFLNDVGFYVIHRTLHHPSCYWIHKRHHEHFKTRYLHAVR